MGAADVAAVLALDQHGLVPADVQFRLKHIKAGARAYFIRGAGQSELGAGSFQRAPGAADIFLSLQIFKKARLYLPHKGKPGVLQLQLLFVLLKFRLLIGIQQIESGEQRLADGHTVTVFLLGVAGGAILVIERGPVVQSYAGAEARACRLAAGFGRIQ